MAAPPVHQLQVVQLVCSAVTARRFVVFVNEGDVLIGVEPNAAQRALAALPSQQG
jgi:hydrogenase maturation factor